MNTQREEMAASSEIVHCYGQLAARVALMAQLARSKEWSRLPELESQCTALVERLKDLEQIETLDPAQYAEMRALISRIRADQDEVCGLVKPQLEQLIARMSSIHQQQSLDKAYGSAH
jgi:flagellar protein FliT